MNIALKQRLIGAAVLVAFGLILWPLLFSEVPELVVDRNSQIPPKPQFETYEVPSPKAPEGIAPVSDYWIEEGEEVADAEAKVVAESAKPESKPETQVKLASQEKAKTPPKPKPKAKAPSTLAESGLPRFWALQVGSFKSPDKARTLRESLIGDGHKASIRRVGSAGSYSYRVFVGPKLDKAPLEKVRAQVDKRYGVKSIIVSFKQ